MVAHHHHHHMSDSTIPNHGSNTNSPNACSKRSTSSPEGDHGALHEQDGSSHPYAKITSNEFSYTVHAATCTFGRKIDNGTVDIPWSESKCISRHLGRIEYNYSSNSWEILCEGKGGILVDGFMLGKPNECGKIHYNAQLHHQSQITIADLAARFEICTTEVKLCGEDEEQGVKQFELQQEVNDHLYAVCNTKIIREDSCQPYVQIQNYFQPQEQTEPYAASASPISHYGRALAGTSIPQQHEEIEIFPEENQAEIVLPEEKYAAPEIKENAMVNEKCTVETAKRKKKKPNSEPKRNKLPGQPNLSYASMICQALMSHPEARMTLNEIYSFISEAYPCFEKGVGSWQNSLRHNLSMNKAFTRVRKGEGKGGCWMIAQGSEHLFDGYKYVGGLISRAESAAKRKAFGDATNNPNPKNKKAKTQETGPIFSTLADQSEGEYTGETTTPSYSNNGSLSPFPEVLDVFNHYPADTTLPSNLDGNGPMLLENDALHHPLEISAPNDGDNSMPDSMDYYKWW